MSLEFIKNEFTKYVRLFNNMDYDINYKYKHSFRVMELSFQIAKSLNLSKDEVYLATIIGLLHDIGRFKQIKTFNGYSDLNIDHGDLGAEILFDENRIERFAIDKKYYDIIKFAIGNHNKLNIEDTNDEISLLHAKIIRDADKIDILRAFTMYGDYVLKESNDVISPEVSKSFFETGRVLKGDIKNKNDGIILKLSLILDINFDETFKILERENIVGFFRDSVKNKELFEPYLEYVEKHIKERNKQNVRKKI